MNTSLASVGLALCLAAPPIALANTATLPPAVPRPVLQHVSRRTLRNQVQAQYDARAKKREEGQVALTNAYANDAYAIAIRYPDGWDKQELNQKEDTLTLLVLFLSPLAKGDAVRENVNVVVEDISKTPLSLQQYTDLGVAKERQFFEAFSLEDSADVTVAGREAHQVTYTATLKGQTLRFRQVWLLQDGNAFVWTFADTPENFSLHLPVFERMLGTLMMK